MSVLNQSGEEQVECPLCMEPLEVDDLHFYPCTCGYQICRFCWNRIREGENGLCPACRKAYPENPADFTPLSQEQVAAIKTEKKAREQKRRNKTLESRRALANVRVVQNNLVFVVGLPVRLADPEILKRQEYFGKYGKIHKVVINQSTAYAGSQGPSASAYVTYVSSADALRAIQGVNNVTLDGRVLKGSLGTTKYCANFMKNQPCPKPDCMYLHELGDPKASFTKEEMHAGLHQVYERKLHNQLQQATRDTPTDKQYNSSGNSSTSAEKSSSKDGNQSNNVPTAAVTSPNINVVNSSKSKKEQMNGSSQSSSSSGSDKGSKEAWPSLGSSPPAHSPARKLTSPKPHSAHKSQENGTSESSSPTQLTQAQTNTKSNKDYTDKSRSNSTNPQPSKKSKSDKKKSNSINEHEDDRTDKQTTQSNSNNTIYEPDSHQYLSNELDELESDRHSLLENHDLLDNSDHNLLEDDNTHNLLSDGNNDVMMMLRHKEMFAGLVENNHMPKLNGYGLLDRDTMSYLGNDRQISQKIAMPKGVERERELRREELNRSELLLRQNEMLARRAMQHKHYMPDSASEMLGANYHPNHSMLPPFGMRVDNSMGTSSLGMSNMSNNMSNNMANMSNNMSNMANMSNNMSNNMANMSNNMSNMANMSNNMSNNIPNGLVNNLANNMPNSLNNMNNIPSNMNSIPAGFMLHTQMLSQQQQQQQMQQNALVNGFDTPQASEGRYLAENMDKFFTDFHKAQQRRLMLSREEPEPPHMFANMLSAERLEMEHKQRMNNLRVAENSGRAAGDGDDDLDFDPFKETQKALQEMMETELMQGGVSSGDNMERVRRSRLPPPGFGHVAGFPLQQQQQQQPRLHHHQAYSPAQNSSFSDWTQMDPAIMSTSVNLVNSVQPQASLSHQHQELFAKFNQLQVASKLPLPPLAPWGKPSQWGYGVPLPPGFAPAKPGQRPAECIDAK